MTPYKKFTKNFLSKERTFTKKEDSLVHGRNLFKGIATIIIEMKIQERYRKPIEEFVRRALEKYRDEIVGIILFGSVARGDYDEESDIDILVVGEVKLEELVDIAFPILLEYEELISVKEMKKKHFDFLIREGYSFIKNVLKDGIVLYSQSPQFYPNKIEK